MTEKLADFTSLPPEASLSPNLDAYLEQRRRTLRSSFQVRPLSGERRQATQDIIWAQHDPSVRAMYEGEFVVPWEGKIVAHGEDARAVLEQAAEVTGRCPEDLPLVGLIDPVVDIPD